MRFASIGNGKLLVNLDEVGRIVDFYYPYIGMENQTSGNPIRFGVWDGEKLITDNEFQTNISYLQSSNIIQIEMQKNWLRISSYSFVDKDDTVYYSIIKVLNNYDNNKTFKFFYVQDFNIYSNPFGDTAFYDPYTSSIIHYKSKRYLGVKIIGSEPIDIEYNTGKDNLFNDLYDGKLDLYPIAHGNVQSAIGLQLKVNSNSFSKLYYVIVADRNLDSLREKLSRINGAEIESRFISNYLFWKSWVRKKKQDKLNNLNKLYDVSLFILRNHMDINGAFIASSDFSFVNLYGDSYQYCWPRDCAYAAYALDISGYGELSIRHFNFIKDLVSPEGFLYHKYNPNKTLASSWHPWIYRGKGIYPIQEDETALEIWAIGNHYEKYKDLDEMDEIYRKIVKPGIKFMMQFIEDGLPKPSFDLWEERYGIHLYTTSTVYGALVKGSILAKDIGDETLAEDAIDVAKAIQNEVRKRMVYDNRLIRRIDEDGNKDLTIDASMYAPYFFGMLDAKDPLVINTMELISQKLSVNSGIIRYENDYYQRRKQLSNPWIITTLWLAEYYIDTNRISDAEALIKWVIDRATPSGLLPEQVDPESLQSVSVIPLVWSHAEYIISLNKYETVKSKYD
ncbi:glycoside hydrolase family 15 protein [Acidianus sulfidivorans JP7]|uniref:Glucan 1,3-alpha-glucosidase n=1 Tax=Acidianus sulfidivorans JP7 TaxID=619593 RepID=A0A2U9IKK9_9CREN|nr:glycoside hydrolase family 15 protein [Acidianus sulfidivorans]AWR96572.1 glycoside hydrolase family 15 protein [Acidianus sulfidivorans JP7]